MTEPREPETGDAPDEEGITAKLGRVGAATGRFAMRPAKAVASAGKDALNEEAERAIDGVLAGPLPEAVGRSLVEHHVIERLVKEALEAKAAEQAAPGADQESIDQLVKRVLENPALERTLVEVVNSRMTTELADAITASPAFKRTLHNVLSSPEVRHALTHQTTSWAGEIVAAAARGARRADESVEATIRRAVRQPRSDRERLRYAGIGTRGLAFLIDLLLAQLVFVVAGSMIGIIGSLFGEIRPQWLVGLLVGLGWYIVIVLYFVAFWSTTGQTPGMRMLRLRVLRPSGEAPGLWRSLVRLIGLGLAIIPFFAGFIPVFFDAQRRALQDYLAGTAVAYEPDPEHEPVSAPATELAEPSPS